MPAPASAKTPLFHSQSAPHNGRAAGCCGAPGQHHPPPSFTGHSAAPAGLLACCWAAIWQVLACRYIALCSSASFICSSSSPSLPSFRPASAAATTAAAGRGTTEVRPCVRAQFEKVKWKRHSICHQIGSPGNCPAPHLPPRPFLPGWLSPGTTLWASARAAPQWEGSPV